MEWTSRTWKFDWIERSERAQPSQQGLVSPEFEVSVSLKKMPPMKSEKSFQHKNVKSVWRTWLYFHWMYLSSMEWLVVEAGELWWGGGLVWFCLGLGDCVPRPESGQETSPAFLGSSWILNVLSFHPFGFYTTNPPHPKTTGEKKTGRWG